MEIIFTAVDKDRVHTTRGPTVRFDFVSQGGAAVRALLSVGNLHIGYSTKDGKRVTRRRTLSTSTVHGAAVMVAAAEVDGHRDYALAIAINGVPVVSTAGDIPAGEPRDIDDQSFQLEVLP